MPIRSTYLSMRAHPLGRRAGSARSRPGLVEGYPARREDCVFRRDATPDLLARIDRLTAELAQHVAGHSAHPLLRWSRAGKVRLRIGAIIAAASLPAMGTSRGDRGLRRHLWCSVDARLRGWHLNQALWWEPPNFTRSKGGRRDLADRLAKSIRRGDFSDKRLEWSGRTRVRLRPTAVWSRSGRRPPRDWLGALNVDLVRRLRHVGWHAASGGWLQYTDPHGVVGWCRASPIGDFVRCLDCGEPESFSSGNASRLLSIEEIRPQPQHCHRCGKRMVDGILESLPDRYPRPTANQ